MFAGQRAAQSQRQREHLGQCRVRACVLVGVIRVIQDVDVQVAVAGMAEGDDGQVGVGRQLLHAFHQFRNARHRHHHVFVDLARRNAFQRGRQRTACGPQFVARAAIGGDIQFQHAVAFSGLGQRIEQIGQGVIVAISFDQQHRAGVRHQRAIASQQLQAARIHEFEHGRRDRLRHHPRHRCRRCCGIAIQHA
ncbi:hypothetical protein D3C81_1619600 [compost metagenome]